ncbi:hypothetical protein ACJX0J_000087 [Zea mays]
MGLIPYLLLCVQLTLFLGATLALAQRDIKRSLAYSTMSQLGYMIQNMVLMGGLRKYVPITRTTFLCGTLSLCGIPPLACFCNSWLYSPFFGIIASFTAGLTAFYMFRIYLLTFDGYLRKVRCIQYPYGEKSGVSFFSQNIPKIPANTRNKIGSFSTPFGAKNTFVYPHETGNTMLFPLLILLLFTLFIGSIGIHFDNGVKDNRILELTILSNLAIFGLLIQKRAFWMKCH